MDHVIGFGVRAVAKGIAVTSEAIAGRKGHQQDETLDDTNEEQNDFTEREWQLDELPVETGDLEDVDPSDAPPFEGSPQRLALISSPRPIPQAILLPQRRPRDRRRGFVRAYAPLLGEYSGIDQKTFISFINQFDTASKASPIFDVINIAAFGVGLFPSAICMAVSSTVGTASKVAQEVQIRYRSNKYLDDINSTLFKPRGLYAMIMTYRPDKAQDVILRADTSDPTSLALSEAFADRSKAKEFLRRLRKSSGIAKSEFQIPECAPLIYPAIDKAIGSSNAVPSQDSPSQGLSSTKDTNFFKSNSVVIKDYLDRRSQALLVAQDPNSKLAKTLPPQQKQFVNRFCDPDHPVNSGSLSGLLTGGTWDPIASGRVRRAQYKAQRSGESTLSEKEAHDAYMGRSVRGRVTGTPSKVIPLVSRILKPDLLYMVVVNLPSDEELEAVRRALRDETV